MRNYLILTVLVTVTLSVSGMTQEFPMEGFENLPSIEERMPLMGGMNIINPELLDEQRMGGMEIINPELLNEQRMGGMEIINPELLNEQRMGGMDIINPAEQQRMGGMDIINPAEQQRMGGMDIINPAEQQRMGGMNIINPAEQQRMGGMNIINPAEQQRMGGMNIINPAEQQRMGGMNIINPSLLPQEIEDDHEHRVLDVNACLSDKFLFDEGPNGNKCKTHCDCDGLRTCSKFGWCKGTSRTEEIEPKKEEVKIGGGDHDNWKNAWKKLIKDNLIGGGEHDQVIPEEKFYGTKQERHHMKKSSTKKLRGGKHTHQKKHAKKGGKPKHWKKAKKAVKVGGGDHDNWKKTRKEQKVAPTHDQKPYGFGSGGDWTIDVKPLGVKKQDTLEDQVARQNNYYKDGPKKHYSKKNQKIKHHKKVECFEWNKQQWLGQAPYYKSATDNKASFTVCGLPTCTPCPTNVVHSNKHHTEKHHTQKKDTLEDQVARQNNYYKDGPMKKHYSKQHQKPQHHHHKAKNCQAWNDSNCNDQNCAMWAKMGECDANPKFMIPMCPVHCNKDNGDHHHHGKHDQDDQDELFESVFMMVLVSLTCCGLVKCVRVMKNGGKKCGNCCQRQSLIGRVVASESIPNYNNIVRSEPVRQPVVAQPIILIPQQNMAQQVRIPQQGLVPNQMVNQPNYIITAMPVRV